MTDKEFVEQHWNNARYDGHRILADHYLKGTTWILSGNSNCPFEYSRHMDESSAWLMAARFTRVRLREILEVEEEIEILQAAKVRAVDLPHMRQETARSGMDRILARQQSVLEELKRGMK